MRVLVRAESKGRRGFEFALGQGALAVCRWGELDTHCKYRLISKVVMEFIVW